MNDSALVDRAEIIRQKGTIRNQCSRGGKYTLLDIGSSYLPGEIVAAFLWAQMEKTKHTTDSRLALWGRYHKAFSVREGAGLVRRLAVPADCEHSARMYYMRLNDFESRQ